jgi:hypothetical protein
MKSVKVVASTGHQLCERNGEKRFEKQWILQILLWRLKRREKNA